MVSRETETPKGLGFVGVRQHEFEAGNHSAISFSIFAVEHFGIESTMTGRMRGLPTVFRLSLWSHFFATSSRCQRSIVSGVTMVVSSCSAFRPRAWPAVDVQFAAGFANYALSEVPPACFVPQIPVVLLLTERCATWYAGAVWLQYAARLFLGNE